MDGSRQYIEERSIPVPFSGCWLWLASLGSHGYGNARWNKKTTVAHRVSYEAFVGPIPAGMLVQHSCDNHWCVNPDHLSLGTDATNAIDKQRKGRAAKKLTPAMVLAIRDRLATGEAIRAVARAFDVHQRLIQAIQRGQIWKHIGANDEHGNPTLRKLAG